MLKYDNLLITIMKFTLTIISVKNFLCLLYLMIVFFQGLLLFNYVFIFNLNIIMCLIADLFAYKTKIYYLFFNYTWL